MTTSNKRSGAASAASEPTLDTAEDVQDTTVETPAPVEAPVADTPPAAEPPAATQVGEEAPAPVAPPASNLVKVKLAHPLDKEADLLHLGLKPKEGGYKVHDEVEVTKAAARTMISAGYAQVDPENKEAVNAVLNQTA